jgi:hypothetical protein
VRTLLLVLLAGVLAWALVGFLSADEDDTAPGTGQAVPTGDPTEEARQRATAALRTGTVTLRISTPDRKVPPNTQVGYSYQGQELWHAVNEAGWRRLTDVPHADLTFQARAPGYEGVPVTRRLVPGVIEEIVLMLRPQVGPSGEGK